MLSLFALPPLLLSPLTVPTTIKGLKPSFSLAAISGKSNNHVDFLTHKETLPKGTIGTLFLLLFLASECAELGP